MRVIEVENENSYIIDEELVFHLSYQIPRDLPIMLTHYSHQKYLCYNYLETTSTAINIPPPTVSNIRVGPNVKLWQKWNLGSHSPSRDIFKIANIEKPRIRIGGHLAF